MSETTQKAEFVDCEGRCWKLRLTVGGVEEIKKSTGIELGNEKDTGWVSLLFSQGAKLVEVLWHLVEKQAEKLGVTPEDFGYGFDGQTLEAAGNALGVAVADFFPRSRISQALKTRWAEILAKGEDQAIQAITSAPLPSATNSPASAASTPPG
jgi:hypothetical protein